MSNFFLPFPSALSVIYEKRVPIFFSLARIFIFNVSPPHTFDSFFAKEAEGKGWCDKASNPLDLSNY